MLWCSIGDTSWCYSNSQRGCLDLQLNIECLCTEHPISPELDWFSGLPYNADELVPHITHVQHWHCQFVS